MKIGAALDKEPETKQLADQDSDGIYVTNQPQIVEHAKRCYREYPTIVNEIPPEPNIYNNTMEDYAKVDISLAAAQLAIGESSNLAQIALTYTYNFKNKKYQDYVCILSVLAQIAVDSAKRKFDIDLTEEIARIKEDLDIKQHGLPSFWMITKKDKRKTRNDKERRERNKRNRENVKKKINHKLVCPMNYLYNLKPEKFSSPDPTLEMKEFWIKHELEASRRKSAKVERLIEEYSLKVYDFNTNPDTDWEDALLLKDDFDELINEIRYIYISSNYKGLISWLLNRAFGIGAGVKSKRTGMKSNIHKNRSLLLKVLYTINPTEFLACFVNND